MKRDKTLNRVEGGRRGKNQKTDSGFLKASEEDMKKDKLVLEADTFLRLHKNCTADSHRCGYRKRLNKILLDKSTPQEETLAEALTKARIKFIRQYRLVYFIVDFYLPEHNLVIEVDGEYHKFQYKKDNKRDAILRTYGIQTLHIKNTKIENNIEGELERIKTLIG